MIVVSNTTPVRYLVLIDAVDILPKLFGEVLVPPAVAQELQHRSAPKKVRTWMASAPEWLKVVVPKEVNHSLGIHRGEASGMPCTSQETGAVAEADQATVVRFNLLSWP